MSHVIAYTYNAGVHCPTHAEEDGMTVPYAKDREGNEVGVVFDTDEHLTRLSCDDCGEWVTDPLPNAENALTVQAYPNGVEHVDNEKVDTKTGQRYMDLTPVGMQTPEGVARVSEADFALEAAAARVGREAAEMLPDLDYFLNDQRLTQTAYEDVMDILAGLRDAIGTHTEATEAFMRAVAGAPPRA